MLVVVVVVGVLVVVMMLLVVMVVVVVFVFEIRVILGQLHDILFSWPAWTSLLR